MKKRLIKSLTLIIAVPLVFPAIAISLVIWVFTARILVFDYLEWLEDY